MPITNDEKVKRFYETEEKLAQKKLKEDLEKKRIIGKDTRICPLMSIVHKRDMFCYGSFCMFFSHVSSTKQNICKLVIRK